MVWLLNIWLVWLIVSSLLTAMDELRILTSFNQSVAYCMGKLVQHLADIMFVQMVNFTLTCTDVFLEHLKPVIKPAVCTSSAFWSFPEYSPYAGRTRIDFRRVQS